MIALAFEEFISELKKSFPEVQNIHLNWPGPTVSVKFPYLVVLTAHNTVQPFTERLVKKIEGSDPEKQVYITGQFESRIDVHYLSKNASLKDQTQLIQRFSDFFQYDFIKDRSMSTNSRVLCFGTEVYEKANIQLLDWQLDQASNNIQLGERRSIFELLMDTPRIVEKCLHLIGKIRLKGEIGEKTEVQPDYRKIDDGNVESLISRRPGENLEDYLRRKKENEEACYEENLNCD